MASRVRKYQRWIEAQGRRPELVTGNEAQAQPAKFQADEVLFALARGAACFDFDFYMSRNRDLSVLAGSRWVLGG